MRSSRICWCFCQCSIHIQALKTVLRARRDLERAISDARCRPRLKKKVTCKRELNTLRIRQRSRVAKVRCGMRNIDESVVSLSFLPIYIIISPRYLSDTPEGSLRGCISTFCTSVYKSICAMPPGIGGLPLGPPLEALAVPGCGSSSTQTMPRIANADSTLPPCV